MPLTRSKNKDLETNHALGMEAEGIASSYLEKKGFRILKKRYKTKFGEVDLIIKKGNMICFVEVKLRQNEAEALESITPRVQKRIEHSALFFLSENPDYMNCDMRFDAVVMSKSVEGGFQITHLDNAWEARS